MKKHNQKTSRRKKADNSLFSYYSFSEEDAKKYPVVSKILKQLTPERIKKEIEAIQRVEFPPELQKWVREYEKVGERDEFIWKWIYKGDEIVINSFGFSKKYFHLTIETIFFFHMFTNLIDDISEKQRGDKLLKELFKIPFAKDYIKFTGLSKKETKYLKFTIKVWQKIEENIKKYPYYRKVKSLFEFDVHQLLISTEYSSIVYNNPFLINETEYWTYLPQNMQFNVAFDFYLMYSGFNLKEIGKIRESIIYIQKILRTGNDIGTWEREIKNNYFINSIFIYTINSNIITIKDFKKRKKAEVIIEIKKLNIILKILKIWEKDYQKIKNINKENKSVNIRKILLALEKVTFYHLLGGGGYI